LWGGGKVEGIVSQFAKLAQLKEGEKPYPHQLETFESLAEGKPVLLLAPTGSGKSESVFVPFLAKKRGISLRLPPRLIYTLPMRTLVNSLADRFKVMGKDEPDIRISAQHGRKPESVLFYADVIVATLDQVISSYACAPLTLGPRHGNVPAGAVATSFVAFDEVHTFDPERGLQSSLILADRLHKMSLPFVFMTATLPKAARNKLKERFPNLKEIVAEEKDIPMRSQRNLSLEVFSGPLSADLVLKYHARSSHTLVVCNTVSMAQKLFNDLQGKSPVKPQLIHSRFFDTDRNSKEKAVTRDFGKENPAEEAILVATQVIEVGLDISADLLITEMAPIDALIQRAGRCARWGGQGQVLVCTELDTEKPYEHVLMTETRNTLPESVQLTWAKEMELVDRILGEHYLRFMDLSSAGQAMRSLSKAVFYGSTKDAAAAVRENDSVDVSIHQNPEILGTETRRLPHISISKGILGRFLDEQKPVVKEMDIDYQDDSQSIPKFHVISGWNDIRLGRFYVISSKYARYSPEAGLVLGEPGADMPPESRNVKERKEFPRLRLETFAEHAEKAMKYLEEVVLPKEGFVLSYLSKYLTVSQKELDNLVRIAALAHDVGKLTEEWQQAAWKYFDEWIISPENKASLNTEESELLQKGRDFFLARFPSDKHPPLPPHATVSALVLGDFLTERWDNWGLVAALAIGHHHVVRAQEVPAYRMKAGWLQELESLFVKFGLSGIPWETLKRFESQPSRTDFPVSIAPLEKEKVYTTYVVLARMVYLADRMGAGGGENAILDYEVWRANI
jgi:CRISPR-associated endonuclease/helicase Cas3